MCLYEGCGVAAKTRGLCKKHYDKLLRQGNLPVAKKHRPIEERFFEKVSKGLDADDCWTWMAALNDGGYGVMGGEDTSKTILAHRFSYEFHNGPIPDGLEPDHLCRNHACVNPSHLEPVTHAVNMQRMIRVHANTKKTHCLKGHPLSGPNLYVHQKTGKRACKTCKREGKQKYASAK